MNGRARNIGRVASTLWVAGVLCISSLGYLPSEAHAQDQDRTRNINGFEVSGRFLDVWSQPGSDRDSFYVNGLPITQRRPEISLTDGKVYDSQWFERASYEYHPENKAPYDVMLGLLGSRLAEGRGAVDPSSGKLRDTADAPFLGVDQPAGGSANLWFPETRHTLSGKFLDTWNHYGGLQQFGFPLSEPFEEQSSTDGKLYTVQYFERNRFELHPDQGPPYDVQLGLLGVQQYHLQAVAADDLPIAPAKGVTSAKDTYTEGSLQEPDTLFCNEANTVVALRFCSAITFNDSLVGIDDKGDYFPLAAWYVPTFENGGSYLVGTGDDRHLITKYKLRPGIKWSDGVELTSADAIFSYRLKLEDPLTSEVALALAQKLASVDNPDKYTVVYRWMSVSQARAKMADPRTDKTAYSFLNTFIDLGRPVVDPAYVEIGTVHPEHVLSKIPMDKIQEGSEGTKPTGYGPYIVQDWRMGYQMTLVRNPNYNLTAPPLLSKIAAIFNTDINANISAFLGDYGTLLPPALDGIAPEGIVVPPQQADKIKKSGGIIAVTPSTTWEYVGLRLSYPLFHDIRVRQAISYAINRQQILYTLYKGAGAIQNGPVPANIYHSLENPEFASNFPDLAANYHLRTYAYNPALANQLLDEAGWKPPCGDASKCVREKDGNKLIFTYDASRNYTRNQIQHNIHDDLARVGMDAQLSTIVCGYSCPGPFFVPRNAQAFGTALTTTSTSNFDFWDASEIPIQDDPFTGINQLGYSNPKVDAANRLFKTSIDRATLAEQSAIIQTELMNDAAIIPIATRANIVIYSGKMRGRKPTNSTVPDWWNVGQWYFVP
jgi:ABC-type transport system substrate-binding protein